MRTLGFGTATMWQVQTCYRAFGDWDKFLVNGWRYPLPTNPDRHARIRAKHFFVAWGLSVARSGATITLCGNRSDVVMARKALPHDDWAIRFVEAANAYGLARRNSGWGCS